MEQDGVGNPVKSDGHFALPRPDTWYWYQVYMTYTARKVHYYSCTISTIPSYLYWYYEPLYGEQHHCCVRGAGVIEA